MVRLSPAPYVIRSQFKKYLEESKSIGSDSIDFYQDRVDETIGDRQTIGDRPRLIKETIGITNRDRPRLINTINLKIF